MPDLLQQSHPLTHERDPRLMGLLWLEFITNFPERDPSAFYGKAKVERAIALKAINATYNPNSHDRAFTEFNQLYPHEFTNTTFVRTPWGAELQPFFEYFEAGRAEEEQAPYQEAIYNNYKNLISAFLKHARRVREAKPQNVKSLQEIRGRAVEFAAGALIARMQHPNILLVPSLVLQDRFGAPEDNHDYLYIDTFGEEPIVQPVQIKGSVGTDPDRHKYLDSIALVFGDADLHICTVAAADQPPACRSRDCIVENTLSYLIKENTPEKTAALDTLTANLLIKLSTWQERKESWQRTILEQTLSNKANRKVQERTRRRLASERQKSKKKELQ